MRKQTIRVLAAGIMVSLSMIMGCGRQQEADSVPTEQPTITVTVTPTPEPTATPTPTPTPTEKPTPTPELTATPTPEPTATPTPEPTATPTPEPTATPMPEPTATPTPTPTATPTPQPTATPTPEPTATPTPTSTPTPTVTPTPSPTPVIPEYTFLELDLEGYASTSNNYLATPYLYVRNLPSMYGEVIDIITIGDPIRVTGQCNETGWFRIEYGETVGYFSSTQFSYLYVEPKKVAAWEKEYTFTEMNEKMFAVKDASIYTEPSKSGEMASVRYVTGNAAWVTGQCNETGWYRVDFGGAVSYVAEDCLSIYQPKSKYESCPYPLDSWEDNGRSISAYYVNGVASDTMTQALILLTNRYPFFTRIDSPLREHVGIYSEGDVYKSTVTVVLEEFPQHTYPLYSTNVLDNWARCFYVEGDDAEKIEQAKANVREYIDYYIWQSGSTGEIVESDYFIEEYTEGRIYCYYVYVAE